LYCLLSTHLIIKIILITDS